MRDVQLETRSADRFSPLPRPAGEPSATLTEGTLPARAAFADGARPLSQSAARPDSSPVKNGRAEPPLSRNAIVAAARTWLGTPYLHQASAKGRGADCLGLVRGLYTELYGKEPEAPPPYTPDWNERRPCEEPLLSAARRHLRERGEDFLPGQILIFRIVKTGPAKHCGVVSGADHFIHAYAGRCVVESWLSRWWIERIAGVFDFPGVL
ncbi:MAG: NlpC/P60 family protein [Pseudomonadota bacterium]